jgi:hypothetical protein
MHVLCFTNPLNKMPLAGQTTRLRFTAWMKQGGRWQQVASHANIVVQE